MNIPFNRPAVVGRELNNIVQALSDRHFSGDGSFTRRCHEWLERETGTAKALLTHSCTAALEMAAILADLKPGDEVILPSFTFVSTANAVALRGAVPVFVDIRPDTLNLDESKVEDAITDRTRAIIVVHYAGVACEMDAFEAITRRRELILIEDAAQGMRSTYKGRPLGSIGALGTFSFHETKNVISGEGGALLVNDSRLISRAEIIREKGTNRSSFFRGQVDKYTWVDIGSSYLPGEIIAAFLYAQLEDSTALTESRRRVWDRYHEAFAELERDGKVRRPVVPPDCGHNAHLYYLLLPDLTTRTRFIARLKERGIAALFHYVPLHDSPAGRQFGRAHGSLDVTSAVSDRLVRLPLWAGLDEQTSETVIDAVNDVLATAVA
ncbi:MAG TPA: dTDP-4-amino-4,6-dideoxygalactose transaminase [Gemmatimonadaceae bacterium]|nr:dTDP-4-amino-4,6-dideoxygalactose transaminase [Gemmatimonadaceae bacterium]